MCSGCTSGFRQKWELSQHLWLRARFYLVHCRLLRQQFKGKRTQHRLFPTALGRLQHCMGTVEFRSGFGRRLQSSSECSTVSVSNCLKHAAVAAVMRQRKAFSFPQDLLLTSRISKMNKAPLLCNMTTVALLHFTHKVLQVNFSDGITHHSPSFK